jgi:hypothetical protein
MEINVTSASNAYDLVSRLRPHWLRAAPTGSIGGGISGQVTLVYLDGSRMGGLDALRSITSSGILSMEWVSSTRAPIIFTDIGSEAVNGVISIKTK